MGAHSRPRRGLFDDSPGRHRGELAPYIDADLTAAAGKAAAGLATAGVAGAAVVTGVGAAGAAPMTADSTTAATSYAAPTAQQLYDLRVCESSDNYATNTGNGYYGAYQFDLQTWQGLGYGGYPNQASAATQDQAATRLEEARGWEPWPTCSRKMGLTTTSASSTTTRGSLASRTLDRTGTSTSTQSHVVQVTVPAFPGTALSTALVSTKRSDVLVWQSRMARRGWTITVDGYFGPQSQSIAKQFAAEKKITSGATGTVDATMWKAAWTAPIT